MSEINADVLAAVERALKNDPDLPSKELQAQAAKVDASVAELTGRQFHARYALQAKRKLSGPRKSAPKKSGAKKAAGAKKRGSRKAAAKKSRGRKAAVRKASTRSAAAKKSAPRKRTAKKRPARRAAAKALATNDPVRALLREEFEDRRASLDGALDQAFKRAIEADSLAKINSLLASLDRQTRELGTA